MIIRPFNIVLAILLCGGLLRADPDKKKPDDDGISVKIHDGKIELDGIQNLVDEQLKEAFDSIDLDHVPAPVRDKLKDRLGKLRGKVGARLKNLNAKDLDQLGEELGKMGEDIGKEMEDFGSDMDKWGQDMSKKMGKDWAKKFAKGMHGKPGIKIDVDDDDDVSAPDVDDDDDLDDAIKSLADLKLAQPQKDQIAKVRADSEKQVAAAKQALDAASKTLHDQLEAGKASDTDIAKSIDAVTQQEATIRKARILAWVHARGILDDAQRKKVEATVKSKTK
jgi:hypothetical protein